MSLRIKIIPFKTELKLIYFLLLIKMEKMFVITTRALIRNCKKYKIPQTIPSNSKKLVFTQRELQEMAYHARLAKNHQWASQLMKWSKLSK